MKRFLLFVLLAISPYRLACFAQDGKVGADQVSSNASLVHPEIAKVIQGYIDSGEVAGAVTLVADDTRNLHLAAQGKADIQSEIEMGKDSIFWIASMSKPITGACIMILVDQGKLKLDDTIDTFLPDMKNLKSKEGKPVSITIRHLMTHTSGMAELKGGEAYTSKNLEEAAAKYAKVEVLFEPGSKWQYSQTSINTAARIVEVVSGISFDQFVDQKICKPLDMKDTAFYLSADQAKRLAKSYSKTDKGLVEAKIGLLAGRDPTFTERMPAANGGLFSTAQDYSRFCRMLLNRGELGGKRVLSAESVQTLQSLASGDLTTGFTPGNGWGIGCCLVRKPQGVSEALSAGSFGHGGAYGTQAWIDPTKKRIYILMVQRSNFPNSDASDLRRDFQNVSAKVLQ